MGSYFSAREEILHFDIHKRVIKMVYFLTVLCLALALCVQGFAGVRTQPRTFFHFSTGTHVLRSSSVTALKAMSLDEIREKIKNTPGYNPMQDPEAMKTLEENIPQELREVNGALQRMQVAFKVNLWRAL